MMKRLNLNLFRDSLKFLFRLFFVPQCPVCNEPQATDNICSACFNAISFLGAACRKCQEPFEYQVPGVDICEACNIKHLEFYNSMHCVIKYNETIKNLIVRYKNQSDFGLGHLFAKWIFNKDQNIFSSAVDDKFNQIILVPVPLFKKRIIKRGYNQSLLLVRCLSKFSNLSYLNVLERTRDTNSQATKTIAERADNVKGAFALAKQYQSFVRGKNFIIVDDVITTGATLFECAKILHAAGAKNIELVAIARRLKKSHYQKVDLSNEMY